MTSATFAITGLPTATILVMSNFNTEIVKTEHTDNRLGDLNCADESMVLECRRGIAQVCVRRRAVQGIYIRRES